MGLLCGPGIDTVDVDATIPPGGDTPIPTDTNCEMVNLVTQRFGSDSTGLRPSLCLSHSYLADSPGPSGAWLCGSSQHSQEVLSRMFAPGME